MPPAKPTPSFEELYKQLEEKVALLEQGGLSLDDSLSAYEEAVGLAQQCQAMLDKAELRITRLRESIAAPDAYVAEPEDEEDMSEVEIDDEEVL
jgi:exodeoxyribonuclease VII small subunit